MSIQVPNFTPVAQNNKPKGKKSKLGIIVGFLGLFLMVVGLVGYLVVLRKPIKPKVPAAETTSLSLECTGHTKDETLRATALSYTFSSREECLRITQNRDLWWPLIGPLDSCFSTAKCQDYSCVAGGPTAGGNDNFKCSMTIPVPSCTIIQFDCRTSEGGNSVGFNCDCIPPASTPTPTPPVAPSNSPTPTPPAVSSTPTPTPPTLSPTVTPSPTPTGVISTTPTVTPSPTPTGTPSPTLTPSPTPTGPPGPTATPIPVACGTKGCDNSTNPCRSGLICQQASDGSNYCTMPEFKAACIANPSQTSCCTAPGSTSTPAPSPTEIILAKVTSTKGPTKTTGIPSVGVAKYGAIFGAISIGIVLLGLIF